MNPLSAYTRWLHTRWPAGLVERLPVVDEVGRTNVPGLYVVGDLKGIPLLKFSADSGVRAVRDILADPTFRRGGDAKGGEAAGGSEVLDVAIVGGGVSGMAAALEARKAGLSYVVIEGSEPFSTIANFPKGKPIYTYPKEMIPEGDLQVSATVKEPLVEELLDQTVRRGVEPRIAFVKRVVRKGGFFELELAEGEPVVARRAILALGRSGNFRKLGVPGEDLPKVYNRLHDPKDFAGKNCLVVGGGDSAMETAIALARCGANVVLSYRKAEFARPKPDNVRAIRELAENPDADVAVEAPTSDRITASVGAFVEGGGGGSLALAMSSSVKEIREGEVDLKRSDGQVATLPNDVVFAMIGRDAPLAFFRRSGVRVSGEWRPATYASFALVLLLCVFVYHWKTDSPVLPVKKWAAKAELFPFNLKSTERLVLANGEVLEGKLVREDAESVVFSRDGRSLKYSRERIERIERDPDPRTALGTIRVSAMQPSFYYSLAYCGAVLFFGWKRIRRRKTPYVRAQTWTLAAIQVVPLFLLPYVLLPWAGHNGAFDSGPLARFADEFFPRTQWDAHGREYWRSLGFVLAWPLFFWNVFTREPMWGWLVVGAIQTFVLIPLVIRRWGKGAYCGWICSCGALAETMGDAHRHKMPHGPVWNRLNMIGQAFLLFALVLLALRIVGWAAPGSGANAIFAALFEGKNAKGEPLGFPMNALAYVWSVDLLFAGIVGVGFYWHFSGRVWCRFACPLAALMHVYARFSRFAIVAEKKKCISCNVCTSVCHQGIDVMNFANKGLPMRDPECVRCSACVQSCPTGVLAFGRVGAAGETIALDRLAASPVRTREGA